MLVATKNIVSIGGQNYELITIRRPNRDIKEKLYIEKIKFFMMLNVFMFGLLWAITQ
jgi:hypothetical protein